MSKVGGVGSLLHSYAEAGQLLQLEQELNQDLTKIDSKNMYGDTPLLWACEANQYDACVLLLQSGLLDHFLVHYFTILLFYSFTYSLTNLFYYFVVQVLIFTKRISSPVHHLCIKHVRRVISNSVNCLYHVELM